MKEQKLFDKFGLKIADFKIDLNFYSSIPRSPDEENNSFTRLNKIINKVFKEFIDNKNLSKTDYKINFYFKQPYLMLKKSHGLKNLFLFFYEKRDKQVNTSLHISSTQFLYILVKILQELLAENNGFILHGSAVNQNGKAIIFSGKGGSGKSTHMKLLRHITQPLADDTLIIRKRGNTYYYYPSPMFDKYNWLEKTVSKIKIDKIVFLKKEKLCRLVKISILENIYSKFLEQVFIDKDYQTKVITSAIKFIKDYDGFYMLYSNRVLNDIARVMGLNDAYLSSQQVL